MLSQIILRMLKKVTQQRWGPRNDLRGRKKNSAVSWALYVVLLLRVLPTYFDAKDDFFFHFLNQAG